LQALIRLGRFSVSAAFVWSLDVVAIDAM